MYLLQLVQALKYENFNDIQGGLEPASKRDSQGVLVESSTIDLDRSAATSQNMSMWNVKIFPQNIYTFLFLESTSLNVQFPEILNMCSQISKQLNIEKQKTVRVPLTDLFFSSSQMASTITVMPSGQKGKEGTDGENLEVSVKKKNS